MRSAHGLINDRSLKLDSIIITTIMLAIFLHTVRAYLRIINRQDSVILRNTSPLDSHFFFTLLDWPNSFRGHLPTEGHPAPGAEGRLCSGTRRRYRHWLKQRQSPLGRPWSRQRKELAGSTIYMNSILLSYFRWRFHISNHLCQYFDFQSLLHLHNQEIGHSHSGWNPLYNLYSTSDEISCSLTALLSHAHR